MYYHVLYFVFYFFTVHGTYALLTLHIPSIVFYAVVMILQRYVKRNEIYIKFVNEVIQVRKAMKSLEVIYEEPI